MQSLGSLAGWMAVWKDARVQYYNGCVRCHLFKPSRRVVWSILQLPPMDSMVFAKIVIVIHVQAKCPFSGAITPTIARTPAFDMQHTNIFINICTALVIQIYSVINSWGWYYYDTTGMATFCNQHWSGILRQCLQSLYNINLHTFLLFLLPFSWITI